MTESPALLAASPGEVPAAPRPDKEEKKPAPKSRAMDYIEFYEAREIEKIIDKIEHTANLVVVFIWALALLALAAVPIYLAVYLIRKFR